MTTATPETTSSAARGWAVAGLVGATLFWAGNFVVGARAVETIAPLDLVWLRWVIATVPLLVLAQVLERPDWRAAARAWPWLVVLSLLGLVTYTMLLYVAVDHSSPLGAALVNAVNPALIAVAAAAFLGERLSGRRVAGVLVALAGVVVVLTAGDPAAVLRTGFGGGELVMVVAVCVWTAYTVLGRVAPRVPPVTSTALQAVAAVVLLAPVVLLTGGPHVPAQGGPVASLVFIGLFPSVLSYLLWNRALTVVPAGSAGVFMNLVTVNVAVLTVLSGQAMTVAQVVGGALVIGGVVLTSARPHRPRTTTGALPPGR